MYSLWNSKGLANASGVVSLLAMRYADIGDCWYYSSWHSQTVEPMVPGYVAIINQKYRANALGLQRVLNLGSYHTDWQWLYKLHRAMVRPGWNRLGGIVEVDETYLGGKKKPGKRGRGAAGKALVGVAVEDKGDEGIERIRLQHLVDASRVSLMSFVEGVAQLGSTICTDDWDGYSNLVDNGFQHIVADSYELKLAHLVTSLLKRWLLGTYQGAMRSSHLAYYLDEFAFRFNRRTSADCKIVDFATFFPRSGSVQLSIMSHSSRNVFKLVQNHPNAKIQPLFAFIAFYHLCFRFPEKSATE